MRHGFRLGDVETDQPQGAELNGEDRLQKLTRENRRLMSEAAHRMRGTSQQRKQPETLSKVERAMQLNARNFDARQMNAQRQHEIDMQKRWPRPRLLALIVVVTLAAVVPSVTVRLMIWLVIMLLLTAVLLGPERARDAMQAVLNQLARIWGRELHILRGLIGRDQNGSS
ncbi:hypothetical protein NBRC116594_12750 [Shimia sp. NS0008-38b]|uniref:hypothetical protein n=1 Tax=Shimia sp. NS0008-38b TaxID=3127653 RepID=UPI0031080310